MAGDYTVQDGDCIGSIASASGFEWQTLWNHPNNASLKAKRKDPNVLGPGDVVYIPDLRVREEKCATDQKHQFTLKGVPARFRVKLLDEDKQEDKSSAKASTDASVYEDPDFKPKTQKDKPQANVPYLLEIDGKLINGTTGDDGVIDVALPPAAQSGSLTLNPGTPKAKVYPLQFGSMDPLEEFSGVKKRLSNLGFYCGDGDQDSPDFKAALTLFQEKNGLKITGKLDDATRDKLKEVHGS